MSTERTPDTVIDAWLHDGPRQLPTEIRYAIATGLREIPQRRRTARRLLFVVGGSGAAVVAAAIVLIVAYAPRPDAGASAPDSRVEIELGDSGADLSPTEYRGGTVFVSDGDAEEYGCVGSAERTPGARGITVADVTHASVAGVTPVTELGVGADSFIRALGRFGGVAVGQGFVGDQVVPKTDVSYPAEVGSPSRLEVTDTAGTTSCVLDLSLPSRVWAINVVGDVSSHTVAVQAWATTDEGLATWLPRAIEIVRDMNLTVLDDGAAQGLRSGLLERDNSEVRFAYELPGDLELDVEPASPEGPNGVMAFGDANGNRGIIIANVTNSSVHGATVESVASVDDLIELLRSSPSLVVTEPVDATLDGQRALAVDITHVGNSPLPHVDVSAGGEAAMALDFVHPSRLIALDLRYEPNIGGSTIVVQVWAQSEEELESWTSDAMRLVDTIHFLGIRVP